jgi:hypothetical protein
MKINISSESDEQIGGMDSLNCANIEFPGSDNV